MKDLIWKIAVVTLATLECVTLVLRAGNPQAATRPVMPIVATVMAATSPEPGNASIPPFGDAPCVSTVPRSWGRYRGGSNQAGLAFEASDGTLRFVTNLPCGATPVIALEVRRTPSSSGNSSN